MTHQLVHLANLPAMVAATAFITMVLLPMFASVVVATTAFNCKDSLISDQWREKVLNVHNTNRRNLAKGKVFGQNAALPMAKKMKQVYWDCVTEEKAREEAAKCGNPAPTAPANYGTVQSKIKISGTCNETILADTTLRKLFRDGAKKQANNAFVQANNDFNQMAYEETDGIGCSYKRCSSELYLLCFYNKDPTTTPPPSGKIYEETNTLCDGRNGGPGGTNDCVDALCKGALTADNEKILEQISAPLEHKICMHQSKQFMTDDLRDMALDLHNYYRRVLATGWAEDGKIGYAKPAAAMPQLKYDCDIEKEIVDVTKDCGGKTPTLLNPNNVLILSNHDIPREDALKQAVENWWSALKNTGIEDNKFSDSMKGTPLQKYVNMAYQKATTVGCGVQTCPREGQTIIQCGYKVDTPIDDGDLIYDIGKVTCSGCRKAGKACSPLGGLCA